MRCIFEQDNFKLLIVDLGTRENEVEKEARLEKNRLQAADRRARDTQKEKEACHEKKIAFEEPIDGWIKMLSNDDRITTNVPRVHQILFDE